MVCLFWDAIYGLKKQGEGCWDNDWENKLFSVYRIFCFHVVVWPSKRESIVSMQEMGTADSFGEGWIITSGSSLPLPLKFNIDTQNDTMIFWTHHVWYPCLMVKVDSCIFVMCEEKNIQVVLEANPPPNDQISVEVLSLKLA